MRFYTDGIFLTHLIIDKIDGIYCCPGHASLLHRGTDAGAEWHAMTDVMGKYATLITAAFGQGACQPAFLQHSHHISAIRGGGEATVHSSVSIVRTVPELTWSGILVIQQSMQHVDPD
eukprot:365542-Chlamydomonas_euryale.AAC.11